MVVSSTVPVAVALTQSTEAVCPVIVVASWAGTSKAPAM